MYKYLTDINITKSMDKNRFNNNRYAKLFLGQKGKLLLDILNKNIELLETENEEVLIRCISRIKSKLESFEDQVTIPKSYTKVVLCKEDSQGSYEIISTGLQDRFIASDTMSSGIQKMLNNQIADEVCKNFSTNVLVQLKVELLDGLVSTADLKNVISREVSELYKNNSQFKNYLNFIVSDNSKLAKGVPLVANRQDIFKMILVYNLDALLT